MFSCKSVVIILSLFAFLSIVCQQNGTEDYNYINYIYEEENITQPSFKSDSLKLDEATGVPQTETETSESSLEYSTETVELLEPSLSESVSQSLYSVDTDETTTTIDEYISNTNNTDEAKKYANNTGFSCYGRQFGQYADVSKDCRVFHMCQPLKDVLSGQLMYQRITFLCDSDSVFDQQNLVCVKGSTLTHSCIDSVKYYQQSNTDFLTNILNHLQAMMSAKPDNEAIDDTIEAKKNNP